MCATRRAWAVVHDDFYTTLSQVLGVLVLSLMWDSQYLQRLARQERPRRQAGTHGVWFWTKPRVRIYSLMVAAALIGGIGAAMSVLGGFLKDTAPLRITLIAVLALGLVTLLTRLSSDIITATRATSATPVIPPPED
jgi:hypothetical protein